MNWSRGVYMLATEHPEWLAALVALFLVGAGIAWLAERRSGG